MRAVLLQRAAEHPGNKTWSHAASAHLWSRRDKPCLLCEADTSDAISLSLDRALSAEIDDSSFIDIVSIIKPDSGSEFGNSNGFICKRSRLHLKADNEQASSHHGML